MGILYDYAIQNRGINPAELHKQVPIKEGSISSRFVSKTMNPLELAAIVGNDIISYCIKDRIRESENCKD